MTRSFLRKSKLSMLSIEDRENFFRIKSAKIEKKLEKEQKLKKEEITWKA
jgi:hypothetical protein